MCWIHWFLPFLSAHSAFNKDLHWLLLSVLLHHFPRIIVCHSLQILYRYLFNSNFGFAEKRHWKSVLHLFKMRVLQIFRNRVWCPFTNETPGLKSTLCLWSWAWSHCGVKLPRLPFDLVQLLNGMKQFNHVIFVTSAASCRMNCLTCRMYFFFPISDNR